MCAPFQTQLHFIGEKIEALRGEVTDLVPERMGGRAVIDEGNMAEAAKRWLSRVKNDLVVVATVMKIIPMDGGLSRHHHCVGHCICIISF